MVRRRLAGVVVAVLGLGLAPAIVDPAAALPAGAVTLPIAQDPALTQTVGIVGASSSRILVGARGWNGLRFWTGSSSLTPADGLATPLFLTGDEAVWGVKRIGITTVHRRDLSTGAEATEDGGTDVFLAAGPTGWLANSGGQIVFRSGTRRTVILPGGSTWARQAQIDATTVVIGYVPSGAAENHLASVDLASGALTDLGPATGPGLVALTPSDVVWVQGTGAAATLVRLDRVTGARTTRPAPDPSGGWGLVATDAAAAFSTSTAIRILPAEPSGAAVDVAVQLSSVVARGSGFVVSRSGTTASASSGVWSLALDGTLTKILPLPPVPERYSALDLDNGRVVYSGSTRTGTSTGRQLARARTVSGDLTLAAGPESTLPGEPAAVGLSGTRRAQVTLDTGVPVEFVDGSTVTGRVPGSTAVMSGPYAVVDGRLPYRADGSRIPLPASDGTPVAMAGYGSRFAYIREDGVVRVLDALRPVSSTNPVTIGTGACVFCATGLGIAADTVAWNTPAAPFGVAYDLRTKVSRDLSLDVAAVGDGVIVSQAGTAAALDVRTPGSSVVLLGPANGSSVGLAAADDHRVAWTGPDGAVTVARLPFGDPHRPRVLGVVARAAFSPNADGRADTWVPLVDLSKPVAAVTLTVRSGTTVVRTLHGSAPVGSVRDLAWDGRTDSGAAAPDGTYSWTLTGAAADGDGQLAAIDGVSAATGTVLVDRVAETASVSVPASSSLVRSTAGLPVTWRRTSPASRAPSVFDVRWREVSWDFARQVPAYFTRSALRTGTTATAATITGSELAFGFPAQFSVRVRDAAGNVGPWSAWATGSRSVDDRSMDRPFGGWTSESVTGAYLGTTRSSTNVDVVLSRDVIGSRLYVWATTCPTCGRVVVFATDGRGRSISTIIDTRSATTKKRVLVLNRAVVRGDWFIQLSPQGTPGRARVHVDAIGAAW